MFDLKFHCHLRHHPSNLLSHNVINHLDGTEIALKNIDTTLC